MTTHDDSTQPPRARSAVPPVGTTLIEVQDIGKRYGNIIALSGDHDLGAGG